MRAEGGSGGIVMLTGPTGIGKTTLAGMFLDRAGERGAIVLIGRCPQRAWASPYLPVTEALAAHVASSGDRFLGSDLGWAGDALASLVPGVASRREALAAPNVCLWYLWGGDYKVRGFG